MKLAIGADHAGYFLKGHLLQWIAARGHEIRDCGTRSEESVDYPDYARAVALSVAEGESERGILVCGSGVGMAMTANRIGGVRAVVCSEGYSARMARAHNDANVLCLGARVVGLGVAEELVEIFLATAFEGGRHSRRVRGIELS